ncbi:MAG: DUF4249 domain-containing protein [Flavobacteriaceae bacterium]|nr:DUF4249 domain-containing protein [Flavobacteriaceae bacterium]
MKKLLYICALTMIFSCEDVIDVNLENEAPRLVIDASISWLKGTPGNEQSIKLSLSAPYFENEIPPANNAIVTITDMNSNVFQFNEIDNTGIYRNTSFVPELNATYTLSIMYNDETYTAEESLIPVVPFDFVEQNNNGGFTGEDVEIKAYYSDPQDEENYYFFEFISDIPAIPTLEVYNDEFTNGNQIFGYYTEEDLEAGDEVTIRNYGVSDRFYNFMFILLQQNSEEGGGPFETQPATVRGNCINTSSPDNYPLGFFRLSEVDEITYTVQ